MRWRIVEVLMVLATSFARAMGERFAEWLSAWLLGEEEVHSDFAQALAPALIYTARCQGCGWGTEEGDVPRAAADHAAAHGHYVEVSARGSVTVDPPQEAGDG